MNQDLEMTGKKGTGNFTTKLLQQLAIPLAVIMGIWGAGVSYAASEDYPARPVTVIVAFSPGGSTDTLTRMVSARLTAQFGKTFVVENKPGAGGNIGTEFAVRSKPDGHTLIVNSVGPIAINPTLYKKLPFNPITDLDPIAQIAEVPNVLVVSASSNITSPKDLLAKGKAKPAGLIYGSTGIGTASHLSSFMMIKRDNVKATHQPYKGADVIIDVLTGKIDFLFATIPSVIEKIKSGKLTAIAVNSAKRSKSLPNVPTMIESGYPGFEASAWFGFFGPKGTPVPVVAKLNKAVNAVIKEPEIEKKMVSEGADPVTVSPEQFKSFIAKEFKKWQVVVKESGQASSSKRYGFSKSGGGTKTRALAPGFL